MHISPFFHSTANLPIISTFDNDLRQNSHAPKGRSSENIEYNNISASTIVLAKQPGYFFLKSDNS